ncbi:M15 family peptidase [Lentibacillus lipolyticus]|nr:M15 family peptidase [Lentibacillus lipolyticus]
MKRHIKDLAAWSIIILISVLLFMIYDQGRNDHYTEVDNHAPLPEKLDPLVAKKAEAFVKKAAEQGIDVAITETVRSVERQNELYKQGRSEGGNIVTYAKGGESYHNYGLAVDFALRNNDGDIIWDTAYDGNKSGKADWLEAAEIAKELGFEWGGDWNGFKDYPHLQMDYGLSIRQLNEGLRPSHNQSE